MNFTLISSGIDASLAFIGIWFLAAIGGWYAGTGAYYLHRRGKKLWLQLNAFAKVVLCCVGTLTALVGLLLLPATLPSAHSAWCLHKARRIRSEKLSFALRKLCESGQLAKAYR